MLAATLATTLIDSYRAQQLGIVLKNWFPGQPKLALLTPTVGRLDVRCAQPQLLTKLTYGVLVGYPDPAAYATVPVADQPDSHSAPVGLSTRQLNFNNGLDLRLTNLELLFTPEVADPAQLLFWHQLLELVFYSVPVGLPAPELFEQLLLVGLQLPVFQTVPVRLAVSCRLLSLLGLHHPDYHQFDPALRSWLQSPIDSYPDQKIDWEWQMILERWWRASVAAHPKVHLFKSIAY